MSEDQSVIEIAELHKSFNGNVVLDGVNLKVNRGETVVIIGRSGGGKTVLLKHVIGLAKPDAGSIRIEGEEIATLNEHQLNPIRLKMGMLFQEAALFDSMTVFENIAFPLTEHKIYDKSGIKDRVEECLKQVGLEASLGMYPEELSGGMKKRVGLARALAMKPKIMLYDEPTSGVDPLMRGDINRQIRELDDSLGVTALVVTHDIESAMIIGDRIALLEEGRIAAEGKPSELKDHENPLVQRFLAATGEQAI